MRLRNIDFLKGFLIILVIIGHILQGKVEDNLLRSIIYSFHMPLFIGISGYLFNVEKIKKYKIKELFYKYNLRVLLPWVIAVVVYYLILLYQSATYSHFIKGLIKSFLYPYYHLWFISGFLSWVIFTWVLLKLKLRDKYILIIGFMVSFISLLLRVYPFLYEHLSITKVFIDYILHTIRPFFYVFFVLGFVLRKVELKKPCNVEYISALVFLIITFILFYIPNNILFIINYFILNTIFLIIAIKMAKNNLLPYNTVIEWFGKNSLAIYLWHVIPIIICLEAIGTQNITFFYFIVAVAEIIFIFIYNYLTTFKFLRRYFFGL